MKDNKVTIIAPKQLEVYGTHETINVIGDLYQFLNDLGYERADDKGYGSEAAGEYTEEFTQTLLELIEIKGYEICNEYPLDDLEELAIMFRNGDVVMIIDGVEHNYASINRASSQAKIEELNEKIDELVRERDELVASIA